MGVLGAVDTIMSSVMTAGLCLARVWGRGRQGIPLTTWNTSSLLTQWWPMVSLLQATQVVSTHSPRQSGPNTTHSELYEALSGL